MAKIGAAIMKGSGLEDKISGMSWPWLGRAWASRFAVLRITLEKIIWPRLYYIFPCSTWYVSYIPEAPKPRGTWKFNLHFGKLDVPQNTNVPQLINGQWLYWNQENKSQKYNITFSGSFWLCVFRICILFVGFSNVTKPEGGFKVLGNSETKKKICCLIGG